MQWYVGQSVVCIAEGWYIEGGIHELTTGPVFKKIYVIEAIHLIAQGPEKNPPYFSFKEFEGERFTHLGFKPLEEIHNAMFRGMVTPKALKVFQKKEGIDHHLVGLEQRAFYTKVMREIREGKYQLPRQQDDLDGLPSLHKKRKS